MTSKEGLLPGPTLEFQSGCGRVAERGTQRQGSALGR